ncbi:ROK family protein [Janthinobacterium sp. HLX7-2]|uniref:ROK family protein n=1 Tax=Janthinobacterium sp. HLX7-2 TaxID=1259331 RepID=UPI003F2612B3
MLLAIDIGGTKLAAAMVEDGTIVARRQVPMVTGAAQFSTAIEALVDGWPGPAQVSVATTGYIDDGKVYPVNRNIISFWNGFPLAQLLRQRFGCPVALFNDAQAAAWGEYCARRDEGDGTHPANLLFITLSTGVGGGLVLDHRLRAGPHGLAGHVGHAPARLAPADGAVVCGCGRLGCLEMLASGTALARQASVIFQETLDSARLFALAADEPRAAAIVDNAALAVAEAIAGYHMIVDLDEVVIGGSVGLASGMLGRISAALAGLPLASPPRLSAARLGADAGLLGAAAALA